MTARLISTISILAIWISGGAALRAAEGKWTPDQVLQLDRTWLRQQGLELPVDQLWDPARGTGLLAAAVHLGGCSAGLVSADGLILTNHHCLFGILQEHSRPERDLITHGFLARTRTEELPSKTTRVTVPRRFTDVTRQVEAAVPADADNLARAKAIETKQKALVAECEKRPGARCRVAAFDGGLSYVLIDSIELSDIRLVYAPPRAVGEYGGETDNWMWPRHTGDFALARAYVDGQPYHPEFYFPLARTGVRPGDFVMVLGYPGRTMRSYTAAEMETVREDEFKLRGELYYGYIHAMEAATANSAAGRIAVAATLKSLNNSAKNALGQVAGLKRGHIIEQQRAREAEVEHWAASRPQFATALEAKRELDRRAIERRATGQRDFLLQSIGAGALALRDATLLVRLAEERAKPDLEREPAYMERVWPQLRAGLELTQKRYWAAADQAALAVWLEHTQKLAPGQRIPAIDAVLQGRDIATAVAALYQHTRVTDAAERLKMFDETAGQLRARHDALLDLAFALEPSLRAVQRAARADEGATAKWRAEFRRAVIAQAGHPVAPDANSTLRVSLAHVQGYRPRDGVYYEPQTTLAGMLDKETGEEPFQVPAEVKTAAEKLDAAQVPLDFLADADTTGGNSGSPVVNGRGELVGLNFDRVWENVANDFGYNPEVARNVNVDIRFFEWMLRDVQHADWILKELGLTR